MSHRILYEINNSNTGCSHGAIEIDGVQYFFKRLDNESRQRELSGYKEVAPYYPIAKLNGTYNDGTDELILYDFIFEARVEGGMLSDILDETYKGDIMHHDVIAMYQAAYAQTLKVARCTSHDIFFANRISERINKFYSDEFITQWTGRTVTVNSHKVTINLRNIINTLETFFANPKLEVSVISQGDPTEYNIATKPLLLDYGVGGRMPLMAEAAVLNATTAHFGNYLARKYNPGYYQRRGLIKLNEPQEVRGQIIRTVSRRRKEFLYDFADMVDQLLGKPISDDQAQAYACYFAMKLLAVFNIATFDEHETAYLLSLVQDVFDKVEKDMSVRSLTELSVA